MIQDMAGELRLGSDILNDGNFDENEFDLGYLQTRTEQTESEKGVESSQHSPSIGNVLNDLYQIGEGSPPIDQASNSEPRH